MLGWTRSVGGGAPGPGGMYGGSLDYPLPRKQGGATEDGVTGGPDGGLPLSSAACVLSRGGRLAVNAAINASGLGIARNLARARSRLARIAAEDSFLHHIGSMTVQVRSIRPVSTGSVVLGSAVRGLTTAQVVMTTGQVGRAVVSLDSRTGAADLVGLLGALAGFVPVVGNFISTATDLTLDTIALAKCF